EHSTKKVSVVTKKDTEKTTTRFVQNYVVVWLDTNIDEKKEHFQQCIIEVRKIVAALDLFTDVEQCVEYLKRSDGQKFFLITSGSLGQKAMPLIHNMAQVDTIFVYTENEDLHKVWAKDWSKVEGVHGTIEPKSKQLAKATRACDHDSIPMSFVPQQCTSDTAFNEKNLDRLPATYMYSVIFKDIILEIDDDGEKSMNTLVQFCRQQGKIPETEISEFKREYRERSPVWWYTEQMFLFGMLNHALRMLDMEVMTKLGFFIRHLHIQLKELHREQLVDFQTVLTVYRGQGMSKEDFQKLLDSEGGLLSFNNFLSTSKRPFTYFVSLFESV
ncbi:unnamed protein product, partial [Rotaria socialis]